jgi:hypothetical protein
MIKNSLPQRSANEALEQRIEARRDNALQRIVNCGISVQSRSNTVCAVEYLKSHNVGADVIERVLSQSKQRRPCTR